MINFPDHFLFFYFCLYFKICKYDNDKEYFLFPFLLEKWKIRLAEVCTDQLSPAWLYVCFRLSNQAWCYSETKDDLEETCFKTKINTMRFKNSFVTAV